MKTKFYKIIVVVLLISVAGLLGSCDGEALTTNRFKNQYGITLPKGTKIEYKTSQIGWFGDGIKYYVFKFKADPTEFFAQFTPKDPSDMSNPLKTPFSSRQDLEFEETVNNHMNIFETEIPKNYLFDWGKEYSWKIIGGLYMTYFPDINRLIFLELIM
jgi:hypothetical protein